MPSVPTTTSTSPSQPGLGDRAAPAGAEHAGGVRLVDHHARAVAARELDDLRQRRDVAVHREHRVGHDQPPPLAAVARQAPREVLGVEVAVDDHLARATAGSRR